MQPTPALATRPAEELARHHDYLRARLRGLGVAESDLDDAVQDVFEVLVRRISEYDSRFSLRQWMAGVARKVARRHRERRALVLIKDDIPAHTPDPEHIAARQQGFGVLQRFLAGLDADRWAVFVLSELEGLRGTEIAAELDVNLSTVYARLRSARQAFEAAIAGQRGPGRPWLAMLFGAPSSLFRRAGSAAFVTPVVLRAVTVLAVGGALGTRACGEGPVDDIAPSSVKRPTDTAIAARAGIVGRDVDPVQVPGEMPQPDVSQRPPVPDADGWYSGGSGRSVGEGLWTHRIHYRLEGADLVVRCDYANIGDVATKGFGWFEREGFEMVEGPGDWSDDLAAGEQRTRIWRLRASQPGVVRATFASGDVKYQMNSASLLRFVNEGGRLRLCNNEECRVTTESIADGLIDEHITVHLHNDCDRTVELAMLPIGVELPPPDAPRFVLAAGERRAVEIDSGLGFTWRGEDGRWGGMISSVTPGAQIRFYGEGCRSGRADNPMP